jgi:threonylcarbamoyladenosine tRNA methylthiotransferase MtaB
MPEVDGLIANAAKLDPRAWNVAPPAPSAPPPAPAPSSQVQNGCDHACTFCVIPQGRGASRSLPVAAVLREVERHQAAGAGEVVLTGVDLTSWGRPAGRATARRSGRGDPGGFSGTRPPAPLLARRGRNRPAAVRSDRQRGAGDAARPSFAAIGHDLILKRMKRRHLRADAVRLVEGLRVRRPELAFGADLIAGFPTEDEEAHARQLLDDRGSGPSRTSTSFPIPPRVGTPAARMPQLTPQ